MSEFRYGLLISGNLGFICFEKILKTKKINFVFTNTASEAIYELCLRRNIPCFVGNPRKKQQGTFLENFETDVILSINYIYIVGQEVINHAKKYAVNFHGSLLPKYRGRTPHVWAIINNEKETGITAHLMSENCDEGDILLQEIIPIGENQTGADILKEFGKLYPELIDNVLAYIETENVLCTKQDGSKATYFGKRTPEDGGINWDWQKERIRNWVRAQAKPYPGAFTFYKGQKIIIQWVEYSDSGFSWEDANGKIMSGGIHPIVKTSNGAIKIIDNDSGIAFDSGEMFYGGLI